MRVKTGTYTGNGSAGHGITGVGFQPTFLLIKGGSNIAQVTTSTMGANATKGMTGSPAIVTGEVTSLDSDGFTLGTSATVNANTTVYYYLGIAGGGATDYAVGSYTGTGSNPNTAASGLGFQPDLVFIIPSDTTAPRYSSIARNNITSFQAFNAAEATQGIQFDSGGFTLLTTSGLINTLSTTYYYMCLKSSTVSKIQQIVGDGTDNRNITGVGFDPTWAMVNSTGGSQKAVIHEANDAADNSQHIDGTAAAADEIQSLITDGIQIGTGGNVNTSTAKYMLWAMATGASVAGGGNTGGKGKGGGKGGGSGSQTPPGKLKTFGRSSWRLGGRRIW